MQVKIFIGYPLLSELREAGEKIDSLVTIHHQGKEYIGTYVNKERATVKELREIALRLTKSLQDHVTHTNLENIPCLIFPELFVG